VGVKMKIISQGKRMTGSLDPNVSKQTEAEELLMWQI
jgi:hypothetical protein